MKTILVAVDLSPVSSQIITAAANLAEPLHAKVVLLHVVSKISSCVPIGSSMDVAVIPVPPSEKEIEEVKAALIKVAAPLQSRGIEVETIVQVALPLEEIQKQAAHASLVVVGSHGHGGLYHLFNGSVVTALLKHATKPILVVPVSEKLK
jgi:nucleotide-binding universal stress UspA family protein